MLEQGRTFFPSFQRVGSYVLSKMARHCGTAARCKGLQMTWGKKKYLNVAVRVCQLQRLKERSERSGLSQARIVRDALDAYLGTAGSEDHLKDALRHARLSLMHLMNVGKGDPDAC
tara:strand:+ start:162 stop:509 length:348 start_codon:yes stop_codon:yes gene_type:complete